MKKFLVTPLVFFAGLAIMLIVFVAKKWNTVLSKTGKNS